MTATKLESKRGDRIAEIRSLSIDLIEFLIEGCQTLPTVRKIQSKLDKLGDSVFEDYNCAISELQKYESNTRNQSKLREIRELEHKIEQIKSTLEEL